MYTQWIGTDNLWQNEPSNDDTTWLCFRNLDSLEVPLYSVKAHKEIINSIDGVGGLGIGEGAPELVTGSRDGKNIACMVYVNVLQIKKIIL